MALGTDNSRERSELFFGRHEPVKGEHLTLVEDVCNNFSTTEKMLHLIEQYGAECLAIACFFNRSSDVWDEFTFNSHTRGTVKLPIISLGRKPFPQYKQDDPEVAEDVASGNVIWKPKDEWDKLARAMV